MTMGLKGHRTLLVGATHGKLPPCQVWFHRHFGSGDIKFSVDGEQDFTSLLKPAITLYL